MKLNITPDITVELPNESVEAFGRYYYPLRNSTADIFLSGMSKEHKQELAALCQKAPVDLKRLREICEQELQHCISLASGEA